MKIKSLLIGMLACTALVGCTNEDLIDNPENNNPALNGEKAYVVVRLNNSNGAESRGTDGDLIESTDEHTIASANFYFYTSDGSFSQEGILLTNLEGSDDDPNVSNDAIEYKTNNVIVLKDLKQKGTPKYVLAVLNKPTTLNLTNKSISEVQKELLEFADNADLTGGEGVFMNGQNFIMTNSTYNTTAVDQIAYFATAIDEDQFLEQPVEDGDITDPVEIYVERLAAKVKLSISDDIAETKEVTVTENTNLGIKAGTYTAYKLNQVKVSSVVSGEISSQATQLYALVYGWDLNATNKASYLMKNVPAWSTTLGSWSWSEPTSYRANWCYSWNYGEGTYPANYLATHEENGTTDSANDLEGGVASNYTLDYISYKNLSNAIEGNDYCAENTNSKAILTGNDNTNFHAAVTEVLVKAMIVNESGTPVDLFRYDNVLYTEAAYLERLFEKVNSEIEIYCYTGTGTGTDENGKIVDIDNFKKISSEDVKPTYVNEGDGKVSVVFNVKTENETDDDGNVTYTAKTWGTITVGDDGSKTFTEFANDTEDTENAQTAAEKVDTKLANVFTILFNNERDEEIPSQVLADHYNGGMMYYNIPIEHLRTQEDGKTIGNSKATGNPYNEDGAIAVEEAEYGVVRNHWYQISIGSISNLGSAVHDANEDIIPDETENVLYSIAARINVLSWKVVNQTTHL